MAAIVSAIREFARRQGVSVLPNRLEGLIGSVSGDDYESMYGAVGEVIAFFPAHLHAELYNVVHKVVADSVSDDSDTEGSGHVQKTQEEEEERTGRGHDSCHVQNVEDDEDDETLALKLQQRVAQVMNRHEDVVPVPAEEASESCQAAKNMPSTNSMSRLSSDEEYTGDNISTLQRQLDEALPIDREAEKALESADLDVDDLIREIQHYEAIICKRRKLSAPVGSTAPMRTYPNWASVLGADDGYCKDAAELREEKVLSLAGTQPFDFLPRRFGTPYFAEAPPRRPSNATCGETPPANEDVLQNDELGVPRRELLMRAHSGPVMTRNWNRQERIALQNAVASEAMWCEQAASSSGENRRDEGLEKTDTERLQAIVTSWGMDSWEAIVVQHGARLGRRHADDIMCRYVNVDACWYDRVDTRWDANEDEQVSGLMETALATPTSGGWEAVCRALGKQRKVTEVLRRWTHLKDYAARKEKRSLVWAPAQDILLRTATEKLGVGNWIQIALVVGDGLRNGQQCMNRWMKRLDKGRRSGPWTKEELKRLRDWMESADKKRDNGKQKWVEIAKWVGTRTDVQCREKWLKSVDPSITRGPWSEEEDQKLRSAIAELGSTRWARIAERIEHRTDTQCQKRWRRLQRRKPKSGERSRKPLPNSPSPNTRTALADRAEQQHGNTGTGCSAENEESAVDAASKQKRTLTDTNERGERDDAQNDSRAYTG